MLFPIAYFPHGSDLNEALTPIVEDLLSHSSAGDVSLHYVLVTQLTVDARCSTVIGTAPSNFMCGWLKLAVIKVSKWPAQEFEAPMQSTSVVRATSPKQKHGHSHTELTF